jgi:hypothetical protein
MQAIIISANQYQQNQQLTHQSKATKDPKEQVNIIINLQKK